PGDRAGLAEQHGAITASASEVARVVAAAAANSGPASRSRVSPGACQAAGCGLIRDGEIRWQGSIMRQMPARHIATLASCLWALSAAFLKSGRRLSMTVDIVVSEHYDDGPRSPPGLWNAFTAAITGDGYAGGRRGSAFRSTAEMPRCTSKRISE